ncbi:hypothetical protein, partial [Acetobacter papayae]|uniref:hypothetical protein n=1 Tax=Acetobacter papayae TaxID=1076592 RepID=UPI0039ECDF68
YRFKNRNIRRLKVSVEKTIQIGVAHAGVSSKSKVSGRPAPHGQTTGGERHFSLRMEHILPDASARCLIAATLWNGFLQLSAFA